MGEHRELWFDCDVCGLSTGAVDDAGRLEQADDDTQLPPNWAEVVVRVKRPVLSDADKARIVAEQVEAEMPNAKAQLESVGANVDAEALNLARYQLTQHFRNELEAEPDLEVIETKYVLCHEHVHAALSKVFEVEAEEEEEAPPPQSDQAQPVDLEGALPPEESEVANG